MQRSLLPSRVPGPRSSSGLALMLWLLLAPAVWAFDESEAPSGQAVLEEAFNRRYDCDLVATAQLEVQSEGRDRASRTLEIASKVIDGRQRSLGRFSAPGYLRGTSLLTVERAHLEDSDDHFLYSKALRRVRRVNSAQRADSFLGTDLTYEDFERRRIADFEVSELGREVVKGEPVHVLEAVPRYASGYSSIEFAVAEKDLAILRVRYFQGEGPPIKILDAPRETMISEGGHRVPAVVVVRNLRRGTITRVELSAVAINPALEDSLFTTTSLESGRPISGGGAEQ